MNTRIVLTIALLIASTTFLTSCGKYEDGPGFTLLTKKARLTGEWDAIEFENSNGIVTADNSNTTVKFEKNGRVILNEDGFSITGKWEFTSNKEKIKITSELLGDPEELTILRLTNKDLWTKDSNGGITRSKKI